MIRYLRKGPERRAYPEWGVCSELLLFDVKPAAAKQAANQPRLSPGADFQKKSRLFGGASIRLNDLRGANAGVAPRTAPQSPGAPTITDWA